MRWRWISATSRNSEFWKNLGNAENQTRGCWARSKNAIHCAMWPPIFGLTLKATLKALKQLSPGFSLVSLNSLRAFQAKPISKVFDHFDKLVSFLVSHLAADPDFRDNPSLCLQINPIRFGIGRFENVFGDDECRGSSIEKNLRLWGMKFKSSWRVVVASIAEYWKLSNY